MHWCTDAKDLYDSLVQEGQTSSAEHRLALELVILRELLARPGVAVHWVPTDQMLADPLTKTSADPTYLRDRLRDCLWSYKDDPAVAKDRQAKKKANKSRTHDAVMFVLHSFFGRR